MSLGPRPMYSRSKRVIPSQTAASISPWVFRPALSELPAILAGDAHAKDSGTSAAAGRKLFSAPLGTAIQPPAHPYLMPETGIFGVCDWGQPSWAAIAL